MRSFLIVALALSACGSMSAPADAGGGLDPATAQAAESATIALGYAVFLTAPLIEEAEQLRDGSTDVVTRDTMTRTRVEDGISGGSVVTPAGCATYEWSGFSVTATFTGCSLEASGESIDGSVTVAVSFTPTTFTLSFSSLTIGTTTIDGTLALNVGGACAPDDGTCTSCRDTDTACMESRTEQQTLTGSITITGEETSLSITELTLAFDATGATASGSFTFGSTSFVATDVHWAAGDCLPSSGTVELEDDDDDHLPADDARRRRRPRQRGPAPRRRSDAVRALRGLGGGARIARAGDARRLRQLPQPTRSSARVRMRESRSASNASSVIEVCSCEP